MGLSFRDELLLLTDEELVEFFASQGNEVAEAINNDAWWTIRRPEQTQPEGEWVGWYIKAGRGMGKSRTGSETVREKYEEISPQVKNGFRCALVGPTISDVRGTMIEGEALALDTVVPTPTGETRMGALKEGDIILGGDGEPCFVTTAWPVLSDRPCFRVRFRGGVEVIADAEHKWLTEDYSDRAYQRRHTWTSRGPTVRTTAEIAETVWHYSGEARQSNHGIAVAEANFPERDLPIDPYVLGVWLGDGNAKDGSFTTEDEEIADHVRACGFEVRKRADKFGQGILGLQALLRELGLRRNKHIPPEYLRASREQRLSLIQGLMDTDGHVSKRGQCEFHNTNLNIIEGLTELLCSVGVKCGLRHERKWTKLSTKQPYRLQFTTNEQVFRLSRKAERLPEKTSTETGFWYIESVEKCDSEPVRCITVDSPDHTYLITRNYIRTHNSGLQFVLPLHMLRDGDWETAYNRSLSEIHLADGGVIKGYSSEKPRSLRGPQFHFAWVDEPAYLRDAHLGTEEDTTWSNLMLGLRLPPDPRAIITGTPKNNALTKELVADESIVVTTGSTYDNLDNLSPQFRDRIVARYEGTRLGRQELHGEILDDSGSMFTPGWFIHVDRPPMEVSNRIRFWDLAATEPSSSNTNPDWTVGALVSITRGSNLYCIESVVRCRLSPGQRDDFIRRRAIDDGPKIVQWVEQELGAAGKSVVATIARQLDGISRVKGHSVTGTSRGKHSFGIEGKASEAKIIRAEMFASAAEQERVTMVRGDWNDEFMDEVLMFPNGKKFDQVDAVSSAFQVLAGKGSGRGYAVAPGAGRQIVVAS